jgi:hypothetical protein
LAARLCCGAPSHSVLDWCNHVDVARRLGNRRRRIRLVNYLVTGVWVADLHAQHRRQLQAIAHNEVRRRNVRRPRRPDPIHPHRPHPRSVRRFDIQKGIVAHVQNL